MGSRDVDVKSPDGFPARSRRARHPKTNRCWRGWRAFSALATSRSSLVLALALALLLALAAYAQGGSGPHGGSRLWMLGLEPVILVYILAVHPFMRRRWKRAMQSLEALAPHADGAGRRQRSSRRGEWVAVLLGALAGLALARRLPGADGWLWLYAEATSALTFALLAATIYGSCDALAPPRRALTRGAGAERVRRAPADAFRAMGAEPLARCSSAASA